MKMKRAVLILSQSGLDLARRLRAAWPEGTLIFGPSCIVGMCGGPAHGDATEAGLPRGVFPTGEPGVHGWVGPLRGVLPSLWQEYDAIVAVMALGIIVRLAGPLATDKRSDPAVVVVDDAGRFAISVLGGHGAGANELAREVAGVLGATPIITTASESQGLPAVDRIGRECGWIVERTENLTRVAAAVVRRQTVAVWQDAGPPDWWRPFGIWPRHFVRLRAWDDWPALAPAALLIISDRAEPDDLPGDRTVVYRPPTLVAGIGCRRGTPRGAIEAWVEKVFADHRLARNSLAAVATVTLKGDEPGLLAFASAWQVPLVAFPPEQLADQPGIESPSERVRSKVGIAAVAEPAALRAAGASRLLIPKQIGPGITLAVARKPSQPEPYQP
ncbi:MAG: cobalamin biosynthesis protein [Planctomycetaceae bacterium]|nr:cobalamin biosynthesis protein [Planctomycetaceae bacterium]